MLLSRGRRRCPRCWIRCDRHRWRTARSFGNPGSTARAEFCARNRGLATSHTKTVHYLSPLRMFPRRIGSNAPIRRGQHVVLCIVLVPPSESEDELTIVLLLFYNLNRQA